MAVLRKHFLVFVILTLVYLGALYSLPPDPSVLDRYNITVLQLHLINSLILIPALTFWFIAYYGFIKFKNYADCIKDQKDGKGMSFIAFGLWALTLSNPINGIVDVGLAHITRSNPQYTPEVTILNNYISLLIAAVSFVFLQKGSRELVKLVKLKNHATLWIIRGFVAIIGILYGYLTLQNPLRQTPGPEGVALYYLPDSLILLTIVLPTLLIWYSGIEAAYNILKYEENIPGIIYKQSLKFLAWGIAAVIVSSILIQILNTFSTWLLELELGALVQLFYLLIICMGIGFIFIAIGAKKLKKIEEI